MLSNSASSSGASKLVLSHRGLQLVKTTQARPLNVEAEQTPSGLILCISWHLFIGVFFTKDRQIAPELYTSTSILPSCLTVSSTSVVMFSKSRTLQASTRALSLASRISLATVLIVDRDEFGSGENGFALEASANHGCTGHYSEAPAGNVIVSYHSSHFSLDQSRPAGLCRAMPQLSKQLAFPLLIGYFQGLL